MEIKTEREMAAEIRIRNITVCERSIDMPVKAICFPYFHLPDVFFLLAVLAILHCVQ